MSYDNRPLSPQKSQLDPRYLQPNSHSPSMTQSIPDLEQVQSGGSSSALDGYTSDSSRYSHARKPIDEAVNSAFTTTNATNVGIPPEVLAQLASQITANVIQHLKGPLLSQTQPTQPQSAYHTASAMPPDARSSNAGSPPPDRATVYTPPSPYRASEEAGRAQTSPGDRASRTGDRDTREDPPLRPKGPQRISTSGNITILERVWGTLFTEQGESTERLAQFLRGIAVHLIEDYEPKHSLVITPDKMQRYYEETKLANEIYPWAIIFDDRTSSISRMFREIGAQHHLVQAKVDERPDVPGLTPRGFETWVTLLLKAHPEQEFERLAKTALDMPISNPDDKKERFPKEISRRLFPEHGDDSVASKVQKAMSVHCNVSFTTRKASATDCEAQSNSDITETQTSARSAPDASQPIVSPAASHDSQESPERKSQIFSHTDSGVIIDDEDDVPTPQPIERERNPYVAQPGGGKTFDAVNDLPPEVKPATTGAKLGRSLSNSSRNDYLKPRPPPIAVHQQKPTPSAPVDIPSTRRHRNRAYYKDPPSPVARRNRSPSVSNTNGYGPRRSETEHNLGSSYTPIPSAEAADNARKYHDYEKQREKVAGYRYDAARMAAYDPRERSENRERETRPRGQSIATPSRGNYSTEDEYYRNVGGYPPPQSATAAPSRDTHGSYNPMPTPTSAHYPPSAFRETRPSEPADSGFSRRTGADAFNAFDTYGKSQPSQSSDVFNEFPRSQPR